MGNKFCDFVIDISGHKLDVEAELVRKNLRDVDANELERAEAELLAADRSFFEVTDRQLNLEYVPPERREPLRAFCAALQHRAASAAGAVAD